ncbi:Belongs to the arylamine N-acetyltransferase family [Pristimantis euphronides]
MDLKAYLQRVNLTDCAPPSISALRELHRHHVHSVPTESLSIHSGEKIIFDLSWIYDKIVVRRRGGFCYENNGLFLWVLQQLGYQPKVLSSRVRNHITGIYGPPFDYMILTVELEGRRWLCDVGYGEGIIDPFPLEPGWEEEQDSGVYRLRVEGDVWYMERKEEQLWRSLFKFTLEERTFEDFREMCEYQQTSPGTIFVQKSFCSLQLPRARLTYMGRRLISTEYTKGGGSVKTTRELTEEEIPSLLRDKFGIVLSGKLIPKDEDIVIRNTPQLDVSSQLNLDTYLQRIGLTEFKASSMKPSLSTLRTIHRHHVLSVPFESLSIHSGEKIIPEIGWLYDKIVLRNRGGFCFENNGLFLWVLQKLGYKPRVLSGRVNNPLTGVYEPPFAHIMLMVELEGRRWLCDVGFGESITEPFLLEPGREEEQDSGVYRLRLEGDEWYMERKVEELWKSLVKFTLEERRYEDFLERCEFYQTDPSSFFVRKCFCTLQVPDGRLTYMGRQLISTKYTKGGESVKTTQELTEEEIPDLLRDKFGIVLSRKLIPKDD